MSPDRAAGFSDFHDRIDETFGGFGLGGAPGKFDLHGTFRSAKYRLVKLTISDEIRLPLRSSIFWIGESCGTANTQRVGRKLVFEYTISQTTWISD